jgi:hypothetical protein
MIERPELRSKLHCFPIGTTVAMLLLSHFFLCAFLLLAFLLPAMSIKSIGLVDLMNSHPQWIVNTFELLNVLLMYIITPIVGSVFAFTGIRSHVPRRFWLTGLVLLCLLGSSLNVHLARPDPENDQQGMVGVDYRAAYGQAPQQQVLAYTLRFTINLLLCGGFARYYRRKEQAADISGKLL